MSVLQISRIQHRRGLQQDLPNLASAELGYSIDQRRLFIGNGTLGEGAPVEGVTEILTQHTDLIDVIKFYIFKGHESGFISQTGPTPSAPTVRSLQNKFDDFVSVRDFGAIGDGVANDIDAIYRAIQQIYKDDATVGSVVNTRARRTIYFPAGTYNIAPSPEHPYGVVIIPPWVRIVGDGIDSTSIVQTSTDSVNADYVLRFCDAKYDFGLTIGSTLVPPFDTPSQFNAMPTDISIENLTLKHAGNNNVVLIDSAVNINFKQVQFSGIADGTNYLSPSAIVFNAFKVTPDNITFDACRFNKLGYAVISDAQSTNVRFNNCAFKTLFTAFRLGQTSASTANAPVNFRITNSIFDKIAYLAIDAWPYATGIVSTGNSYYDVNGSGTVINFQSDGNYSINDWFEFGDNRVQFGTSKVVKLTAETGLVLGTATIGTGGAVQLATSGTLSSTGVVLPFRGVLNYKIAGQAFGSITFGGNDFADNFVGTTNVALSIQSNTLMYTNSGSPVILDYNINRF